MTAIHHSLPICVPQSLWEIQYACLTPIYSWSSSHLLIEHSWRQSLLDVLIYKYIKFSTDLRSSGCCLIHCLSYDWLYSLCCSQMIHWDSRTMGEAVHFLFITLPLSACSKFFVTSSSNAALIASPLRELVEVPHLLTLFLLIELFNKQVLQSSWLCGVCLALQWQNNEELIAKNEQTWYERGKLLSYFYGQPQSMHLFGITYPRQVWMNLDGYCHFVYCPL